MLGALPIASHASIGRATRARAGTAPPQVPAIVPNPRHEKAEPGVFRLTATTRLTVPANEPGAIRAAQALRRWLRRSTGLRLAPPTTTRPGRAASHPAIRFVRDGRVAIPREGYRLVVSPQGVVIEASSAAGWSYGAASLWQLVPLRPRAGVLAVPAVRIDDAPRVPVRTLELSIDGYRPSPREIRRLADLMTILKLKFLEEPARASATVDLDTRQSRAADEPPGPARVLTLAEVYRAAAGGPAAVRGTVSTAWLGTDAQLEQRLLPRAAALAEVGWSAPSRRHWRDFLRRLVVLDRHTRALGLRSSRAAFRVRARVAIDFRAATALVRLSTQTGYGEIRYTLAGGMPQADSAVYRGPLRVRLPVTLHAADFAGNRRIGPILTRRLDLATAQRRTSRALSLCTEYRPLWLEGEPSTAHRSAKFLLDATNPCWVYRAADLDAARRIRVAVGRVRFPPSTHGARRSPQATGTLVIRLDGCAGTPLARVPLPRKSDGITVLPTLPLPASVRGLHDLCVQLPRSAHGEQWALAWIAPIPR